MRSRRALLAVVAAVAPAAVLIVIGYALRQRELYSMDRPRLIVVQDLSDRTGTTLRRVRPEELGTTSRELNECLTKLRFGNPRDPTHADEVIQANIEANILDVLSEHFPSAISKSYWPLSIVDAADERPALALMAAGALLALALPVAVGFRLHRTASRLTPRE